MANTVAGISGTGIHSARPAGNAVPDGSLYSCTTHSLIYQSSYGGNSWPTWATLGGAAVTDATIAITDITTNNAATGQHGWLKKLDNNAAHYMDGTGAWSTPASGAPARHWCKVYKTVQTANNAILAFDAEVDDLDGMHDNVTNNSRVTCVAAGGAGLYLVEASAFIAPTAGGIGRL